MEVKLTPWQLTRNVNFLSSVDLIKGGDENHNPIYSTIQLTIKEAKMMDVLDTEKNTKESKLCILFEESGFKPMVLNTTNKKAIANSTGTPFIECWAGHKIKIYVEKGIRVPGTKKADNITTDALRISPVPIEMKKCECCGKLITAQFYQQAVDKYGVGVCSGACLEKMGVKKQDGGSGE